MGDKVLRGVTVNVGNSRQIFVASPDIHLKKCPTLRHTVFAFSSDAVTH